MRGQADQVRAGQVPAGEVMAGGGGAGGGGQRQRAWGLPEPLPTFPRASPPSHLALHFSEIILIHSEHFMGRDCTPLPHAVILHKDTDDRASLLSSSGKPPSVSH